MNFYRGRMRITEAATAVAENPLRTDPTRPLESLGSGDMSISQVRAIYPMIRALNSDRLTRNFTFYPRASLVGKDKGQESTGYASYVKPFGKPLIREHNLQAVQGFFGPEGEADIPMGRIVYSTYVKQGKDVPQTLKDGFPGSFEGTGHMLMVAAVSLPEAVERILGGVYHTVSIGADVESVIESISGVDIARAYRNGDDLPEYRRGQTYEGKLSYWTMGPIIGRELSYVNAPADELAQTERRDIGEYGLRLLLGQKKVGSQEFSLFDARSLERLTLEEGAWDTTYDFKDSVEFAPDTVLVPAAFKEYVSIKVEEKPKPEELSMEKMKEKIKTLAFTAEEFKAGDMVYEACHQELPAEVAEQLTALVDGTSTLEFENVEAMREATDKATEIVGELNEKTMALACAQYFANEHKLVIVEDLTVKCTLGHVFGEKAGELKDKELGLTLGEFRALTDEDFAFNLEHAILKNKLVEGVNEFAVAAVHLGCESDSCKQAWESLQDQVLINEQADLEKLAGWAESWSWDAGSLKAAQEKLNEFETLKDTPAMALLEASNNDKLNDFDFSTLEFKTKTPGPLLITVEFFVNKFVQQEASIGTREYLAPLVGLVRKLNVDKATFESAQKAYSYLGSATLRSYLKQIPESAPVAAPAKEEPKTEQIEGIPAIAAVEDTPGPEQKTETDVRPQATTGIMSKFTVKGPEKKSRSKK